MIGFGLNKFAKEKGLRVDAGIAYGSLQGYAVTLREGAGYKQAVFATRFADPVQLEALREVLESRDTIKDFRVQNISLSANGINVVFLDNPGTMKKMEEFFAWFLPLLGQYGASGVEICAECGMQITDAGVWLMRNDAAACHVHGGCARKLQESVESDNTQRKESAEGSYGLGALGALLGALLGAVVWAVVLIAGYVASLAGLLIGYLANKGYGLLKGKEGKGKIAILIVAIIVGVLLGTLAGIGVQIVQEMDAQHIPMEHFADVLTMLVAQDEFIRGLFGDIGMGLLFAGLGTFGMLRQESKLVADSKIKILK